MIKPIFNINGSSPRQYRDDACRVLELLQDARKALGEIAPHGRDYQTCSTPGSTLSLAMMEHRSRVSALEELEREIEELAMHAADAIIDRRVVGDGVSGE